MGKLRFALYGYGKVAELHAKALASLAETARLVSVIGRDKNKREAFAARWDISARASAAGLHVLVEKPMALSTAAGSS